MEVIGSKASLRTHPAARARAANILSFLALFGLGTTIVLIPFRYRFLLESRPIPPIFNDYTDLLLFASDIFLIATLLFWAASLILRPHPLIPGPIFLWLPLAGVSILGLLSVIFSLDPLLSLFQAGRLALLDFLYLFIVNEIRDLKFFFIPVGLQLLIQSVVGVTQVLSQHSLGLAFLGELKLDPAWSGVSIVWAAGIRSLRAYGLTDHPNILGGCLAFSLILIATWYFKSTSWQPLIGGAFTLGVLGLLLTFSRSAWLALGAGLLLMLGLVLKYRLPGNARKWFGLLGMALIIIAPFLWENAAYLGVRLDWGGSFTQVPQENQSIGERGLLIDAADQIFAGHALTGVGLGTFPEALLQGYPNLPVNYQPVHIALLEAASEIGIFGAFFYALLIVAPWLALWLNRRRLKWSPELIGVSGLLLAVTIVGFFDYYTWLLAPGRLWQWLAWGLWAVTYQSSLREVKDA